MVDIYFMLGIICFVTVVTLPEENPDELGAILYLTKIVLTLCGIWCMLVTTVILWDNYNYFFNS